jgi:hypothetical protein
MIPHPSDLVANASFGRNSFKGRTVCAVFKNAVCPERKEEPM